MININKHNDLKSFLFALILTIFILSRFSVLFGEALFEEWLFLNPGINLYKQNIYTLDLGELSKNSNPFHKPPLTSIIYGFFSNFFFNKKNQYITDSINGYRAIRADTFKKLNCDEAGYAIEYQMTIRALKADIKIKEFPTIENNRIAGISQAPSISAGFIFIRCLLKELIKKFF